MYWMSHNLCLVERGATQGALNWVKRRFKLLILSAKINFLDPSLIWILNWIFQNCCSRVGPITKSRDSSSSLDRWIVQLTGDRFRVLLSNSLHIIVCPNAVSCEDLLEKPSTFLSLMIIETRSQRAWIKSGRTWARYNCSLNWGVVSCLRAAIIAVC